MAEKKNKKWVA